MAMLDREKFFERIKERLGEDDSDEALSFLERVTVKIGRANMRPLMENGENVIENVSSEFAKK